jgi:hypothetical protein
MYLRFMDHYTLLKDFASPVATIVASIAALGITWRLGRGQIAIAKEQKNIAQLQAELTDIRLKHDLFDRRIKMFNAARDLVLEVFHHNDVADGVWNAFVRDTEAAEFLFKKSITDYIVLLRNRAAALRGVARKLEDQALVPGPERDEYARIKEQNVAWFQKQFEVLIPAFRQALALESDIATRLAAPPDE